MTKCWYVTHSCNLKDEKGISLAAVLVTVIVALIILTSIVYSNNRTKEIQQAMLLNSDIEQLSKKIEVYYLEKQILPIDENNDYAYWEDLHGNGLQDDPKYYRIQLSLLENLNLNNKEIINEDTPGLDAEDKQWYVMNKETHTIYLAQNENNNVVVKNAKYDEGYNSILMAATANGVEFNKSVADTILAVGDTSIVPGIDKVLGDTTSLGVSSDIDQGTNKNGTIDPATGKYLQPCYQYVGYADDENWHGTGDKASSIVLHYDGEYNRLNTTTKLAVHDPSHTTILFDLSGNDNYASPYIWGNAVEVYSGKSSISPRSSSLIPTTVFENKGINVPNQLVIAAKGDNFVNNTFSNIPGGSDSFTIELVVYTDVENMDNIGLFSNMTALGEEGFHLKKDDWGLANGINYSTQSPNNKVIRANAISEAEEMAEKMKERYNPYFVTWGEIYNRLFKNSFPMKFNTTATYKEVSKVEWYGVVIYGASVDTSLNYDAYNGIYTSLSIKKIGGKLYWYDKTTPKTNGACTEINLSNGVHTFSYTYQKDATACTLYIDGDVNNPKTVNTGKKNTWNWSAIIGGSDSYIYALSDNDDMADILEIQYKNYLNNKVYSVRIYNKALSADEVAENYATDKARFGSGT